MHTRSEILQEIVELNEIKRAYNHYLCSYEARHDVENTTYILANKSVISYHLKELYALLAKGNTPHEPEYKKTIRLKYKASKVEQRAILNFNSDKRFSITE